MDTYEIGRLLASQSYQNWINKEVFTVRWFIMLGVLVVVYSVWLKLLDKTRLKDLLLYGSLVAVGFMLSDMILGSFLGLYSYKISLVPFRPSVLIASVTIVPILFMLVMQYTSSWRRFILWGMVASAAYSFVLVPLYAQLNIVVLHKGYNYFYSFLRTIVGGVIGRAFFLWFDGIQTRHLAARQAAQLERVPTAMAPVPAMKPLDEKEDE